MLRICTIILLLISTARGFAQFNIKQETDANQVIIPKNKELKVSDPQITKGMTYSTDAIMAAEKRRIRKERNFLNIKADLSINQIYFKDWAKGGDNTFSGRTTMFIVYNHKRERFSINNRLDVRLGVNVVDTMRFKNEDYFEINSQMNWAINQNWSYTGNLNMKSQFMKGYKSMKDKTLVSDFLSPANVKVGLGFSYEPKNKLLKISIMPLTGNMLIVRNDLLSSQKKFGLEEKGQHFKPEVGPSLSAFMNKQFWKNRLSVRSSFESFYNFRLRPTASWENTVELKAFKWLALKGYAKAVYDDNIMPEDMKGKIQYNYSLGLVLVYEYKNK